MVVVASVEEDKDVDLTKMLLTLLLMTDSTSYLENLKCAIIINN
jgi:hypothetical protein